MFFFYQAEDGIRDLVRSRGLGDVYKRQGQSTDLVMIDVKLDVARLVRSLAEEHFHVPVVAAGVTSDAQAAVRAIRAGAKEYVCLLYTSDAADDLHCVDLGGRRDIKKKK